MTIMKTHTMCSWRGIWKYGREEKEVGAAYRRKASNKNLHLHDK